MEQTTVSLIAHYRLVNSFYSLVEVLIPTATEEAKFGHAVVFAGRSIDNMIRRARYNEKSAVATANVKTFLFLEINDLEKFRDLLHSKSITFKNFQQWKTNNQTTTI